MSRRRDRDPWRTSVLRMKDDKTLQLIIECRNEQCLWNTNLPDYPNKDTRLAAYEAIAKKLDIPNFKARHVSIKFKNLRNSYCQELKKMGADDKYKPKVFWFKIMDDFLRPHLQLIRTYTEKTKLLLGPNHNINDRNTEPESEEQAVVAESVVTDWAIGHDSIPSDGSCSNSMNYEPNNDTQERTPLKIKKRKLSDLSENEEFEIKQSHSDIEIEEHPIPSPNGSITGVTTTFAGEDGMSTERPNVPSHHTAVSSTVCPKDHYDAFGTYIATLLRMLPAKKALKLQPKIINLVLSVGLDGRNDDNA